ncbi:MAG: tetratricopeptide repeat protein [Verrucomicrobiales bacterium]|nr:tetratricopeptide repeat protein [Verrucomicrobiales bacterium]
MSDWAVWLRLRLGRYHEAREFQQEAYDRARETLGETHELTLRSLSELALLAHAQGHFGKNIEIKEHLLPLARQAFGPDSPNAMFEQMRLAWGRLDEGRLDEAEALLTHARDRLRDTRGSDDFLTRRAMRWLSGVFTSQGRYEEGIQLRREVLDLERRLLSADAPWLHMSYYGLANLYARIGQWPQAAQLFADSLPYADPAKSLRPHENIYAAGLVAALRAGDAQAVGTIGPLALRHAGQPSESWEKRRDLIVSLLLAPDLAGNGRDLDTIAAQVIAEAPAARGETLLPALLALRRGQFTETTRLLAPSLANPAHPAAGLASALAAIAQHRLGNADDAIHLLLEARDCLDRLSRAGDLGRAVWYPHEEWLSVAHLALVCREAETLIHGEQLRPIPDEQTLATAREGWRTVGSPLEESDRAAIHRDWPTALEHLRTAIGLDYFDWSAAMLSRENFGAKAATLLASRGELSAYPQLIEQLIHEHPRSGALSANAVLLMHSESLPTGKLDSIVAAARFGAEDGPTTDGGNPWWSLELGLAELGTGNPQAALTTLKSVVGAFNLRCAGAAHAIAALAHWQLGEYEPARQRLAQAIDAFAELTDGNRQSLGPNWHEMLFLELTIQKAAQLPNADR